MNLTWFGTVGALRTKKEKRARVSQVDSVMEQQVRGILQKADQKLILMVRQ